MSKWLDEARNQARSFGLVDDRDLVSCANAMQLPNGEYGLVVICANRNYFTVCDANMTGKPDLTNVLYTVPLHEITDFKASAFPLTRSMSFRYAGAPYSFKAFGPVKEFIEAVSAYVK